MSPLFCDTAAIKNISESEMTACSSLESNKIPGPSLLQELL